VKVFWISKNFKKIFPKKGRSDWLAGEINKEVKEAIWSGTFRIFFSYFPLFS